MRKIYTPTLYEQIRDLITLLPLLPEPGALRDSVKRRIEQLLAEQREGCS